MDKGYLRHIFVKNGVPFEKPTKKHIIICATAYCKLSFTLGNSKPFIV